MKIEELAKKMYTAYCEAVGGKAHNGDALPTADVFFEDSGKKVQADGGRACAVVARALVAGDSLSQANTVTSTVLEELRANY